VPLALRVSLERAATSARVSSWPARAGPTAQPARSGVGGSRRRPLRSRSASGVTRMELLGPGGGAVRSWRRRKKRLAALGRVDIRPRAL
jgi:hypothetical protein